MYVGGTLKVIVFTSTSRFISSQVTFTWVGSDSNVWGCEWRWMGELMCVGGYTKSGCVDVYSLVHLIPFHCGLFYTCGESLHWMRMYGHVNRFEWVNRVNRVMVWMDMAWSPWQQNSPKYKGNTHTHIVTTIPIHIHILHYLLVTTMQHIIGGLNTDVHM